MKRTTRLLMSLILSVCMTITMLPLHSDAAAPSAGGTGTCTCTQKCTASVLSTTCPVCATDYSLCGYVEMVTVTIDVLWIDGNDSDKTRPTAADYLKILEIEGVASGNVTRSPLPADVSYTSTGSNSGKLTCTMPKYQNGVEVTYTFVQDEQKLLTTLGYIATDNPKQPGTLTNVQAVDFEVNVNDLDGDKISNGTHPELLTEALLKGSSSPFELSRDGNAITTDTGNDTWTFDPNTGSGTYTYKYLPRYDLGSNGLGGSEYQYTLTMKGVDKTICGQKDLFYVDGTDLYQIVYDNTNVENYGTKTDKVYNGGTVELTLRNETEYHSEKYWLDDNQNQTPLRPDRPDLEFELWRYTETNDGKHSYKTASPVRANGTPVTFKVTGSTSGTVIPLDISTNAGSNFTLKDNLPMYDANGYRYVYFLMESMTATSTSKSYEQIFDADVVVDGSGNVTQVTENDRTDKNDESIYNGGTISNRITENTDVKIKKNWVAKAYIDSIADVEVEMALEYRPAGGTDADWRPYLGKDGKQVTEIKSGFCSAQDTLEWSQGLSKYDSTGKEIEYRWVEKAVYENGDRTSNKLVKTDALNGSFVLDNNTANMNNAQDTFTLNGKKIYVDRTNEESFTSVEKKDGSQVTNTLTGKVDYVVVKKWENADGTTTPPAGAKATFVVTNNQGLPDIEIDLDGTADSKVNGNISGSSQQEQDPWLGHIMDLPKYTEDGSLITYFAYEKVGFSNYTASASSDAENRVTTITNSEGTGLSLAVMKKWIDDNDSACRYPSFVNIVYKAGTRYENVLATVELNGNKNAWYTEYDVPKSFLEDASASAAEKADRKDKSYYSIREVYLKDATTGFPVETTQQYGGITSNYAETVTTDKHMYVTSYSTETYAGRSDVLCVTNRRVGSVDITATKIWKDKGMNQAKRPGATMSLSITSSNTGVTFDDKTGTLTVAGVKTMKVEALQSIEGTPGQKTVPVPVTVDSSAASGKKITYVITGLPKYDQNGKVINYAFTEKLDTSNPQADPSFVVNQSSNFVPEKMKTQTYDGKTPSSEERDEITLDVVNKRQATTSIVFYKEWKDAYQQTIGHRPDIFVELYSTDQLDDNGNLYAGASAANPTPVGYRLNKWSTDDRAGRSDANKYWKITFPNIPRYDDDGGVITYYGLEETSKNVTHFDYQNLEYLDDQLNTRSLSGSDTWVETASDKKTVLQEDGTFVNRIANVVKLSGMKTWQGIPANYKGDLPKIDVYVLRYLAGKSPSTAQRVKDTNGYDICLKGITTPTGARTITFSFYHKDGLPSSDRHLDIALEKYDASGDLYVYTFEEVIHQTTSRTSGVTLDELFQTKIDETNITNSYPGNNYLGKIEVSKEWKNRPANVSYPKTTFELHRIYTEPSTTPPDISYDEVVATQTVTAADWQADPNLIVNFKDAANPSGKTFPIYAPDGFQYVYYVKEIAINGYNNGNTQTVDTLSNVTYSTGTYNINGTNTSIKGFTFDAPTVKTTPVVAKTSTGAALSNTYTPGMTSLYGTKIWKDQNNIFNTRPIDITLEVFRYALTQPGQNNAIASAASPEKVDITTLAPTYPVWTKSGDTWNWNIGTSQNPVLDKFAPNGTRWIYIVKEVLPAGYEGNYTPVTWTTSTDASTVEKDPGEEQSAGSQTNDIANMITVTKVWDSKSYSIKPDAVFELQVRLDNGSWQHAGDAAVFKDIPANSCPVKDGTDLWQVRLKDTGTTTQYSQSFYNLPKQIPDNGTWKNVDYRFVEIQVGTSPIFANHGTSTTCLADPLVYPTITGNGQYQPYDFSVTKSTVASGTYKGYASTQSTTKNKIVGDYVDLLVRKVWVDDANNKYNTRPASVTFKLQSRIQDTDPWADLKDNNGNVCQVAVSPGTSGAWESTVNYLPKYNAAGQEVKYRAIEVSVSAPAGYAWLDTQHSDTKPAGVTTTFYSEDSNKLGVIDVSVEKKWNDNGDSSKRPADITLYLWADYPSGTTLLDTAVVTPDNTGAWKHTFTNLPKYKPRTTTEATYTVTEKAVPNYHTKITGNQTSGYVVTNTVTTSIPVEKLWVDSNNKWNSRPINGVQINLHTNGNIVNPNTDTVTVKPDSQGDWKYTFTDKDKYDDNGKLINYTVTENPVAANYIVGSIVWDTADSCFKITNLYAPTGSDDLTAVDCEKIWDDNGDQDGKRPQQIDVILYRDGSIFQTKTVQANTAGRWTVRFDNLPKIRKDSTGKSTGVPYDYTVQEKPVKDYKTGVVTGSAEKGYVITNKHDIELVDVSVEKTWDDKNDRDKGRADDILVQLYADGKATTQVIKLDATGNWSGTFKGLEKYRKDPTTGAGGVLIDYTVKEVGEKADHTIIFKGQTVYTVAYTSSKDYSWTITNTHIPEEIDIPVEKVWDDDNNHDGKRPASVDIQLYADGAAVSGKKLTLNENNSWKDVFKELPKYDFIDSTTKREIQYTVAEVGADQNNRILFDGAEYTVTIAKDANGAFLVTNSHENEPVNAVKPKKKAGGGGTDTGDPTNLPLALLALMLSVIGFGVWAMMLRRGRMARKRH